MPMLYVIQHGGNFVPNAVNPENIVYLACSVVQVASIGKTFYFSDGHGTDRFTRFYDYSKLPQLPDIIDWEAITKQYWGTANLDVKRKKQAEFIIEGDIPPHLIIGFGCFNKDARNRLIDMGVLGTKIKIIPNAYYSNGI
ncbi:protein of unknown function [Arachidicoccus rhizosphaerae]|uniref:DarT domain-containing protein n=2 Tax=Arachidicoccus rhizosphaerae TaxID=551991 RepID=A0A1H4C211_9BACT|nr:protein of unknown function [Arachidicoccus rhizosphaerae]